MVKMCFYCDKEPRVRGALYCATCRSAVVSGVLQKSDLDIVREMRDWADRINKSTSKLLDKLEGDDAEPSP